MKVLIILLMMTVFCQSFHTGYDQLCLQEDNDFLKHPHDCHKFIRCSHQRAYEFQCPSNLLWHHEIKTCDLSNRTQCKLYKETDSAKYNKNLLNDGVKGINGINGIYKDNLVKYSQIEHDFPKKFSKLTEKIKRGVNTKRKCKTRIRENVKTTVNINHTGRAVTERIFTVSAGNIAEAYNRYNAIMTETLHEKNIIKSILNSNSTEQIPTNYELIEINFTNGSAQNMSDFAKENNSSDHPDKVKDITGGSVNISILRDGSTDKATQVENNYNRSIETVTENSYVNLTETTVAAHNTETCTLNHNTTGENTNVVSLDDLKSTTGTRNNSEKIFFNTATVKSTDNISFTTKDCVFQSTKSSNHTKNKQILKDIMMQTATENKIVNLTDTYTSHFYSLNKAENSQTAESSEIAKEVTDSLNLTDLYTVKLPDKKAEVLSTLNPINYLKNYTIDMIMPIDFDFSTQTITDNKSVENYKKSEFSTSLEVNSFILTPSKSASYAEPVKSTSTFPDYYSLKLTEKDSLKNSADTDSINISTNVMYSTGIGAISVNLTNLTLTSYLEPVKSTTTIADNTQKATLSPSSSQMTGEKTDLSLTDNTIVRIKIPIKFLENSTDSVGINISTEFTFSTAETTLSAYLEPVKSITTVADNATEWKNENINIAENFTLKSTEYELKMIKNAEESTHTNNSKETVTEVLTKAVTNISKQNLNNTKPADHRESSENYNDLITFYSPNVSHLTTESFKKVQVEFTTTAISTPISKDDFAYDSATQDPRLPFRSIECQGPNNRRQLKALKCYQYYQCFAGWAFLLNCHEGWRFLSEEEHCVLDVSAECASQ